MMDIVVAGVAAGVIGTIVMDLGNFLFSRAGLISKIDVGTIGRMAAGWTRGRFRYGHPSEMREVANEKLYGFATHYGIGLGFALPFVFGWDLLVGGLPSPLWALAYGIATTAASWFFVYPCMGFGAFGLRSPDGLKATLSSLANHVFFGVGMGVGVGLV